MHLVHNGEEHEPIELTQADHAETVNTEVGHAVVSTDGGILASLGINSSLFLFQLLNFALVAGIVWFLILKPLTKKMEERKNLIDESLDRAKEIETNFKMSEVKFQESLDRAKEESNGIIAQAKKEAEIMGEKMKEKTKDEIEALVLQAKKKIDSDKVSMQAELRKETVEIVVTAMEKILGEKMDDKKDKKFVEDILKTIK